MNENTFYENSEILDQGDTADTVGSSSDELSGTADLYAVTGTDQQVFLSPGPGVPGEHTVSDGNFGEAPGYYFVLDSNGSYIPFTVSGSDAAPEQVQVQDLSADDLESYFSAVNYRLDTIIFLLLVFWCVKRIKIAVANFTGRSLDGRKDKL